ncbi:MAG TPA: terminase family protein [Bryobacteraceae bacterium]|nr:terminase family protein [Bryobacteraceae bacterium]
MIASAATYRVRSFPSQRRFYELKAKYSGFSGPVGSGKTNALVYKALRMASANPGCLGLLGAPTIPMLRTVTMSTVFEILEKHEIPFEFRSQSASLLLKRSGSRIVFRPLEYFDRLRGYNLAWFGIDELTYCKEGAWLVLQQRIRDPKARQLGGFAVWTPKGFDWVYDRFISPVTKLEGYEAVLAGARENIAILARNPRYYQELKASYDEKFYRQEAEGEYLNIFSGRVYYAYEAERNDAHVEFNPHKRLNWALDFNLDPMSSVLLQDLGGNIRVLDEISLRGASINEMCARFAERIEPLMVKWRETNGNITPFPVGVYGDAAANSGNIQTKKSDYQAIREYFRSLPDVRLEWNENTSNPPIKDRVASVNRMLCDAMHRVRILIDPRCKELRTDLLKVSWKRGAEGFELDKRSDLKRTHMSDAFGYYLYRDHRLDSFQRVITVR